MNMIFELIGLLLVVGCAFFTTFFLGKVRISRSFLPKLTR